MKEIKKELMTEILEVVGKDTSGQFTSPKPGEVTIKDMRVMPERNQPDGTKINAWVRVDFEPAGSCSLRSLLISPEITWTSDQQEQRINKLASAKLEWQFIEPRMSKANNPYKVAHVKPITL